MNQVNKVYIKNTESKTNVITLDDVKKRFPFSL